MMYMYPCGGGCRAEAGWYNAGYIFPAAFQSRVNFRSSVQLDQLVPLAPCPPPLPPSLLCSWWPLPLPSLPALHLSPGPLRPRSPPAQAPCSGTGNRSGARALLL